MVLAQLPVEDLPACMEASIHLRTIIEATFLNEASGLSRISELNRTFQELVRRESDVSMCKARKLLKFKELDVNCYLAGTLMISSAFLDGKLELASLLLTREDLDVNALDKFDFGFAPVVHHAAMGGHYKLVEEIVNHPRYTKGQTTAKGYTALHLALLKFEAKNISLDTVRVLLESGDSPADAIAENGATAVNLAKHRGREDMREDICRLLEAYGADMSPE